MTTKADHYFEYPPLIVIMDLLLLREKAFSHVLFNKKLGKRPVQLGVLALIADTFHSWLQQKHWVGLFYVLYLYTVFIYSMGYILYSIYWQKCTLDNHFLQNPDVG